MKPTNIRIKFNHHTVTLRDADDTATTPEGVVIHLQKRQSDYRAWATIPDGTLEQFKRCKPEIVSAQWEQE